MAYTIPESLDTYSVARKVNQADLNNDFRDGLIAAIDPPRCSVYSTSAASITSGTFAEVAWSAEHYDTDTMHDNATNNGRIYLRETGVWRSNWCVTYSNNATGGRRTRLVLYTYSGGYAGVVQKTVTQQAPAGGNGGFAFGEYELYAVTDATNPPYLTIETTQESGGALTLANDAFNSSFQVRWIALTK